MKGQILLFWEFFMVVSDCMTARTNFCATATQIGSIFLARSKFFTNFGFNGQSTLCNGVYITVKHHHSFVEFDKKKHVFRLFL